MNSDDLTRKFVFDRADVRGELVKLGDSYRDILDIHQYAPGVAQLLGEFLAAVTLLSTTIKFEGRLILQAQSEGEIPLLMAECTSKQEIRGIARGAEHATSTEFATLLASGRLALTIEPDQGQRYQGIVALEDSGLAASLEGYFLNSEQLPTRLWLASDARNASGLLLQQLPSQLVTDTAQREEDWVHACTLADTLSAEELLELSQESLLHRLFHEDPLQVFSASTVRFNCSCSRERCAGALVSLGETELTKLFEEQPSVSMDCEFCNQQYLFEATDFGLMAPDSGDSSLH